MPESNKESCEITNIKICQKANEDMEKILQGYQKATVEAVCRHFEQNNKVLLADEVGLGKTYIAKGVVTQLALKHWEKSGQEKPFRVAYICPNLNVANQNYPKFQNMYADSVIEKDDSKKEQLEAIRNEFPEIRALYRRVCDWLIGLYDGKSLENAMDKDLLYCYLKELSTVKGKAPNSESGEETTKKSARNAVEFIIKVLGCAKDPMLSMLWNKAKFEVELDEKNEKEFVKKISKAFYAFNKAAARYLLGQTTEDYRLSMQHLYWLENQFFNQHKAVQFECLTPGTSFHSEQGKGTYQERALIYATLHHCYDKSNELPEWWPKISDYEDSEQKDAQFFGLQLNVYRKRLEQLDKNSNSGWVRTELGKLVQNTENLKDTKDYKDFKQKVRTHFVKKNVENFLEYDLVIMDEFQNFSDLINGGKSTIESEGEPADAFKIAQKLFSKKECKVLLLSATPFAVSNYVPDGYIDEEENCLEDKKKSDSVENDDGEYTDIRNKAKIDAILPDFKNLVGFMCNDDDSKIEKWIKEWEGNREKPEECRKLMHEIGIFRTERNAATRHSPIVEEKCVDFQKSKPDFTFARSLKTNLFVAENDIQYYRSSFGDSTPFPLVFGRGYQFSGFEKKKINSKYRDLFLTEGDLSGVRSIETGHARFEALKKSLFKTANEGADDSNKNPKFSPASMLWIPPCRPKGKLKGAFSGRDGYSKSLIFSHFRMTPKAFTYLLCNEAAVQIMQRMYEKEEVEEDEIKEFITQEIERGGALRDDKGNIFSKTGKELVDYFTKLFSSNVGIAAVRSVHSIEACVGYVEAVKKYCDDGCFVDMLSEYVGLLKNEYSGSDAAMAKAVNSVKNLEISNPKLNLLGEDGAVESVPIKAENCFAVGLFPENDNANDLRKRMANIKGAFNSPFWPFVFTTTSIGSEGIDLHWYARNIVHWDAPLRPLDIEQREGRVMRYRCHAYRLNEVQNFQEDECVKPEWQGSGMFETQLNFSSDSEEECYHVVRQTCFLPVSREEQRFEDEKRIIGIYRKVLGREDADKFIEGRELDDTNEFKELDLSAWMAKKERGTEQCGGA